MPLDLRTGDPGLRVDDSAPRELLAAARVLDAWDDETRSVADYLLNAWTMRACMSGDPEDLADLETTLRALLDRLPTSAQLPDTLKGRWQGYIDLLAGRALCRPGARDMEAFLARDHVRSILDLLPADGSFRPQSELNPDNKLSPARLSQILGAMADHGLVQFRRRGKFKDWRLIGTGQRHVRDGQQDPLPTGSPSARRGSSAFTPIPRAA